MTQEQPQSARAHLASLVKDFKSRIQADESWGEEGYALADTFPQLEGISLPDTRQSPQQAPARTQAAQPARTERPAPPRPHQPSAPPQRPIAETKRPTQPPAAPATPAPAFQFSPGNPPQGEAGFMELQSLMGRCMVHPDRKILLVGEGNPGASLVFIGEDPGGLGGTSKRPFEGPVGDLLNKMIGAMGYGTDDVFVGRLVLCGINTPGASSNPPPCRPLESNQNEEPSPRIVVTLGRMATQTILETDERISRMRGRWFDHHHGPIKVMPTYHPAALLRNAHLKRPVWEDLQKVMAVLKS